MPFFSYKAKNKVGEVQEGEMEAVSELAVSESLVKTGFYPYKIEEKTTIVVPQSRKKKVNLVVFTRQLFILVKSGVPLSRALRSLETSSEQIELRDLFREIRVNLDNGYELFVSMQRQGKKFSPFYINMVRIGESTGRLEEVLAELYKFLEFEQEMKSRAKSAIRYPIMVISVMIIAFIAMMVFVIPTFGTVYKGFNAELPWQTKILIDTSNFMVSYGVLLFIGIMVMVYMFITYLKTEPGDFWWGKFKFGIPIVGKILKKSVLARFSRAFSLSLKSGIPIVQSLSSIEYVIENTYVKKHIESIKESIERGNTLYGGMKSTNFFEPLVLEMIATGEESGELEAMCDEISYLYSQEIEYELKHLSDYIEPVMLLILGVMVLILALGIFLPIWDLGKVVLKK
jgi:MSHA biogenesis protein MshG